VAAEGLGSISLRPLITSTDLNSTEAGCAVLAAGRQNKAWDVTAALFRAQAVGGDWVNPTVLRRLGARIGGLRVSRFVNDARGPANYSRLNAIRDEAKSAGVTVTPAFVVRGPGGTKLVARPDNASAVIDAIKSVQ
jgi:protein-disulfide isomerase